MNRPSCHRLAGVLAVLAALAGGADARADALAAVQVLREGGCGGILPAAPLLRRNATLDRMAGQWAAGRTLAAAAEKIGYHAQSTAAVHVSGPDASMLQLLRRSECRTVMSRALREVGVYRHGADTWLVLASASFASAASLRVPAPRPGTSAPSQSWASSRPAPAAAALPARSYASRVLALVNEARASGTRCGAHSFGPAPPVALSRTLDGVASGHALDMAEHGYFEHQDLTGQWPADRVRATGYREKLVGENIAYGPDTAEEVVRGWLDSPGHCANIMDPRFSEMGIAYASGRTERRGLYWVQVLAEPRT
jgi:uncharacterized protein YkwD